MAGGKATRFGGGVEKGLLEIRGRTLLERSLAALQGGTFEEVVVASTPATPKTAERARSLGVRVVDTSGRGYHEDVLGLLDEFGNMLTLNVDVPFIRRKDVRAVSDRIASDSLAAVVPAEIALCGPDEQSVLVDEFGRRLVWAGINYVTPSPDVTLVVLEEPLLAVNINCVEDLEFAKQLAFARML